MNDLEKKDFILSKMVTELEVDPDSFTDKIHTRLIVDRQICISSFLTNDERKVISEFNKNELYYYLKSFFIDDTKEIEEINYLKKKVESYRNMYEHYKNLYKQLVETKENKNGK